MAIPRAKMTMAPILDFLADGREHPDEEIQEEVASYFQLTKLERRKRHKSRIPVYKNRCAWGLVYLQDPRYLPDVRPYIEKAGIRKGRKVYRITRTGRAAQRKRLLDG
jgi:restriction system protein